MNEHDVDVLAFYMFVVGIIVGIMLTAIVGMV